MKLHILAIAAHPDDIELGCSGTLINHVRKGQAVGILDLTESELSTRGTVEKRRAEAQAAASKMGISIRLNAGMADGFFRGDEAHIRQIIPFIRHFRPSIVVTNALADRHPDHGRAGRLVADACFYAGLSRIETEWEGKKQTAWRPSRIYHMNNDRLHEPDVLVDISAVQALKMESIRCYKSQFYDPNSNEPATYIASDAFLDQVIARDAIMGKRIGCAYAEGFVCENTPGVRDLDALILPELP